MAILVTGGSGFIGTVLTKRLLERGHRVYSLSRHPPIGSRNLIGLIGDITKPNLGLATVPGDIEVVYHLAGIHTLRQIDKDEAIHTTNIIGTRNVLKVCVEHNVEKLIFTSTAYSSGWEDVNPYARSKVQNEKDIAEYVKKHGLSAVILKPSIVLGEENIPYRGHFGQFVLMLAKLHHGPEQVRRAVEKALRLPLLRPEFRIPGDPHASLNMVRIGDVVQALLDIKDEGTHWIVNDSPPKLQEIGDWVGETIGVGIEFKPEKFRSSIIEAIFMRKAKPFLPYLRGDKFTSLASIKATPVDKSFIQNTVRSLLKI